MQLTSPNLPQGCLKVEFQFQQILQIYLSNIVDNVPGGKHVKEPTVLSLCPAPSSGKAGCSVLQASHPWGFSVGLSGGPLGKEPILWKWGKACDP